MVMVVDYATYGVRAVGQVGLHPYLGSALGPLIRGLDTRSLLHAVRHICM